MSLWLPAAVNWCTVQVDGVLSCLGSVFSGVSSESSQFWHAGTGAIALASLATR